MLLKPGWTISDKFYLNFVLHSIIGQHSLTKDLLPNFEKRNSFWKFFEISLYKPKISLPKCLVCPNQKFPSQNASSLLECFSPPCMPLQTQRASKEPPEVALEQVLLEFIIFFLRSRGANRHGFKKLGAN